MANKTSLSEGDWPSHESWSAGRVWLAYTLFYGFMPIWLGVIVGLGFSKQGINWTDFLVHGELLIYAASLTAGSTRLIASDLNAKRPFPSRQIFFLMSQAVIIPSAVIFALVKAFTVSNQAAQVSTSFMWSFSIPMVVFSVFFSFIVFVEDHDRITSAISVWEEAKKDQERLSADFDRVPSEIELPIPEGKSQASQGGREWKMTGG